MTYLIQLWKYGNTGWHKDTPNARLMEFMGRLSLQQGDTIFVLLCGKSQDIK